MRRRLILLGAFAITALWACGEEQAAQPTVARPGPWYSGGTLHNVSLERWREAEDRNRLATCADLVNKDLLMRGADHRAVNIDALRPFAVELEACISEAAGGPETPVADVAAECLQKMQVPIPGGK